MIASSSSSSLFFLGISRYWQFNYSTHHFKRYHGQHGLSNICEQSESKALNCCMVWNKKRKFVNPVWRPITTQSTSNKAHNCSVDSIMDEPGYTGGIDQDVGLKDAEGVSGNCMTASTAENKSDVRNEKQAVSIEAVKSPALQNSHFISLPLAIHPELIDKLTRFQSTILGDCHSKDADGNLNVVSTKETSEGEESHTNKQASDGAVNLKVAHADDAKLGVTDLPIVSYLPKGEKGTDNSLGIDKYIFNKPKSFHLTVLMLKLWNKERVDAAKGVLQSVTSELVEALDNRPLFIRLKGLACMKGSPAKAEVLYLPVEEVGDEGRLLRACQIIIDAYVKAGLVLEKDIQHTLKFHATVMNTAFRKGRRASKRFERDTFDARGIFERFGSELWGDYHIREAHLSKRGVYDENGYYHCCASVPFPEVSEVPESSAIQVESTEVAITESV